MSLILEALRKSEAERRLGQSPDVLAPMPLMHAAAMPSGRRAGVAAGIALVLLVGLAFAGWWTLGRSPMPAAGPAPPVRASVSDAKPVSAGPTAATSIDTPAAMAGNAPAHATSMPRDTFSATRATADAGRGTVSTDAPHAVSPPNASRTREALPTALAAAARQAASLPSFAGSPAPAVEATLTPATPEADGLPLLPVTALSASERTDLPALKVTMHAYADDPARRFMIVDGQRAVEGTRLADGIVLVRIRRDGAEIDVRGRRLLLPNP